MNNNHRVCNISRGPKLHPPRRPECFAVEVVESIIVGGGVDRVWGVGDEGRRNGSEPYGKRKK